MNRMNLRLSSVVLGAGVYAALAVGQVANAADIQMGKEKAKMCFSCHGENGQAILPTYPNLNGQSAQYLEIALKAYKNGSRNDLMMAPMAKVLSDQDIANISAYFGSLK
ncbi:c-type cytochrome [Thiomicrorhabdus indica]|uniref:c-type cytochrome n=1 Tax=Thiomicrorhabdus indica TaxID=2267253 RepID=UPI00198077F8|nr:cytochrome c [Thiomicrorhabdus indica]